MLQGSSAIEAAACIPSHSIVYLMAVNVVQRYMRCQWITLLLQANWPQSALLSSTNPSVDTNPSGNLYCHYFRLVMLQVAGA